VDDVIPLVLEEDVDEEGEDVGLCESLIDAEDTRIDEGCDELEDAQTQKAKWFVD